MVFPRPRNIRVHNLSTSPKPCHICLSPLGKKRVSSPLPCKCSVTFHKDCLSKWTNETSTCPICHKNLPIRYQRDHITLKKKFLNKINNIKKYLKKFTNRRQEEEHNRQERVRRLQLRATNDAIAEQQRIINRRLRRRNSEVIINPQFLTDSEYTHTRITNPATGTTFIVPRINNIYNSQLYN